MPAGKKSDGEEAMRGDLGDEFAVFTAELRELEQRLNSETTDEAARRFVHSSEGMELAPFVVARALSHADARYCLYYRCHAWLLALGASAAAIVDAVTLDVSVSPMQPRVDGVPVDFVSVTVGAQLPIALGLALTGYRPVVAVLGDGALSTGVVFETLNAAAIHRPDLLLVIDDNQRAVSSPSDAIARSEPGTLARSLDLGYHHLATFDPAFVRAAIGWIQETAGRTRVLHVSSSQTASHCLANTTRSEASG
jgi:TPP-dependent pyruvate/acetoin dehydrogenase alpha subunit